METGNADKPPNVRGTSSYRTYEEWKLEMPISLPTYVVPVLTVPMRNGNLKYSFSGGGKTPMRSYRTYEEWKLQQVQKTVDKTTMFLPYL